MSLLKNKLQLISSSFSEEEKKFFNFDLDFNLEKKSTIRVASHGPLLIVYSKEILVRWIKLFLENHIVYRPLGWGANVVLPFFEEGNPFVLIQLKFPFDEKNEFDTLKDFYNVPASVGIPVLTTAALKFGFKKWESITGIPASLGGAIVMNAGTKLGEVGEIVESVEWIDKRGEIHSKKINFKNDFSYRKNNFLKDGDIVTSVILKNCGVDETVKDTIKNYYEFRKRTQPLSQKTFGCIFKNHDEKFTAGRMIDLLGIKGLTINDLKVSHLHANFLENKSDCKAVDIETMINVLRDELYLYYGIVFEAEVIFV